MGQFSFSGAENHNKCKRTRREVCLEKMDRSIPWERLESTIEPFCPKAGNGRRPYPMSTMLRIHCLQQWCCLSDPTMEAELSEIALIRQFSGLSFGCLIPDETIILKFRHMLEQHCLTHLILTEVTDYI